MPVRNRWDVGDHLMADDITGFIHPASEMRQQWNGLWVHESKYETRQPQEFVRAKSDPGPLKHIRQPAVLEDAVTSLPLYVGNTTVVTDTRGAAQHLYDLSIPDMAIGTTFQVR